MSLPVHYGWIIAIAGCAGMVASVPGQTIGINVFNEKLIVALSLSRTEVSAAYLVGTAASGFLLPVAGSLFDRLGARRMIALAALGLGLSLVYMSQVDRLAQLVSSGFAGGQSAFWIRAATLTLGFFLLRFWGQGVVMMTSRNMIGKWWEAHRGKVFSVGGIAVAVCFSLAPKGFDSLIDSVGWREAWGMMALLMVPGFLVFGWLFFRDNPRECGLSPDAGLPPPSGQRDNPEFRSTREFSRREALRRYSFWAFSSVFGLQACYFTAYTFHVVDVAADLGMTKTALLNLFVPSAILSGAISVVVGWACDRWRLKYLLAVMAFGNVLAPLGLALEQAMWTPVLLVAGFGIGNGCFGALSGAFMPRFFGLKHLGAISGFFMSLIVISSAVGPFLFSVARAATGSYHAAHLAAALISLALLVAAFWANNPQREKEAALI